MQNVCLTLLAAAADSAFCSADFTVMVRNLPPDTTEAELAGHFSAVLGRAVVEASPRDDVGNVLPAFRLFLSALLIQRVFFQVVQYTHRALFLFCPFHKKIRHEPSNHQPASRPMKTNGVTGGRRGGRLEYTTVLFSKPDCLQ